MNQRNQQEIMNECFETRKTKTNLNGMLHRWTEIIPFCLCFAKVNNEIMKISS